MKRILLLLTLLMLLPCYGQAQILIYRDELIAPASAKYRIPETFIADYYGLPEKAMRKKLKKTCLVAENKKNKRALGYDFHGQVWNSLRFNTYKDEGNVSPTFIKSVGTQAFAQEFFNAFTAQLRAQYREVEQYRRGDIGMFRYTDNLFLSVQISSVIQNKETRYIITCGISRKPRLIQYYHAARPVVD